MNFEQFALLDVQFFKEPEKLAFLCKSRGITKEWKKVFKFKIELDLP